MASQLRDIIEFFDSVGLYDVVLPFLLSFTIVFAIFEKTKVLGTEDGKPKKNLNAIASFAISFLVVASPKLVGIITHASANMVVPLFLSVLFLLLVGSFYKEGEPTFLEGPWKMVFMLVMFASIAGIFLNELPTKDGGTWLDSVGNFLGGSNSDKVVGSAIMLFFVVLFMVWILKDEGKGEKKKEGAGH